MRRIAIIGSVSGAAISGAGVGCGTGFVLDPMVSHQGHPLWSVLCVIAIYGGLAVVAMSWFLAVLAVLFE